MDKLTLKTKDLTAENIAKLFALFPEIITEVEKDGKMIKIINADKLKELIGDYADNSNEVYELNWVGKQKSRQKIVMPINKTLRPVVEDSVDFENTENLYIEGDNFEVLKLLQESYLNKVKMIYIDPPYNTGKDFVYKDNFAMSREEYDDETGAIDDEGNKLFLNTATNGRFHSDWLSMMYERLVIAKDLLRDDGIIFISIDDNEVANLRNVCDEVFGEVNFVASFAWQSRTSVQNDTDISEQHEYILSYAKHRRIENRRLKEINQKSWYQLPSFAAYPLPLAKQRFANPDNDIRGLWKADPFDAPNVRDNLTYKIENPNTGEKYLPPQGRCWRTEQSKYIELFDDKRIVFGTNGTSRPQLKVFYNDKKDFGEVNRTWWDGNTFGTSTNGTKELQKLFNQSPFTYPKPTTLVVALMKMATRNDDIILDFFSGSATTAHAVMQLNAEDGGNRKFIMVQLPEATAEVSEAFKAGYENIAEIGKERIRRAAKKIQEDNTDNDLSNVDFGFRAFKLDSSNMEDVYYNPKGIDQRTLTNFKDNIKEDRNDKDLLYQVLLEMGLPISGKVNEETVNNKTIYRLNDNFLIACFDDDVDLETIKEITELKPLRLVFKDSSFKDDAAKVNCYEYLKNKLPNAILKVV